MRLMNPALNKVLLIFSGTVGIFSLLPRYTVTVNGSLVINVTGKADSGAYVCTATNIVGSIRATTQLFIHCK